MHHPVLAAVGLLFLLRTFASISASCSNEDGACMDSVKSSSSCYPRYIADSYFKKHGNLVESDFKDFLAHDLNLVSSQSLLRVSYLQRDLIGEGSHRQLCSSINFKIQPESTSLLPSSICEVAIIERLPSGVFADPFELEHLVHRGVFKDAAVFGDTNLELPSFVSNQSVVEIHMRAAIDFSMVQKNALELKIEIPVHARYQPLDESGYTRVPFGALDLMLRCSAESRSDSESCSLTPIVHDTELQFGHVSGTYLPAPRPMGWLCPFLLSAQPCLQRCLSLLHSCITQISDYIKEVNKLEYHLNDFLKEFDS